MNNQIPNNFGPFNNNCRCREEMMEMQRRFNQLERRVRRLENAVFSNNWNTFGNPTFMDTDNRTYTTGNYIL